MRWKKEKNVKERSREKGGTEASEIPPFDKEFMNPKLQLTGEYTAEI